LLLGQLDRLQQFAHHAACCSLLSQARRRKTVRNLFTAACCSQRHSQSGRLSGAATSGSRGLLVKVRAPSRPVGRSN
jgi:hypothetical protein